MTLEDWSSYLLGNYITLSLLKKSLKKIVLKIKINIHCKFEKIKICFFSKNKYCSFLKYLNFWLTTFNLGKYIKIVQKVKFRLIN